MNHQSQMGKAAAMLLIVVGITHAVWADADSTFTGQITYVADDYSSISVMDQEEFEQSFMVTDDTSFSVNGEPSTIENATSVGDLAVVHYYLNNDSGENQARSVAVIYNLNE